MREGEEGEEDQEEYRYIDIDISRRGRPRLFSRSKRSRMTQVYIRRNRQRLYDSLREILQREKKSFSEFVWEHAESYVRLHEPGNPQQRLDTIMKLGKAYHAPSRICGFKDCLRDAVAIGVYAGNGETYALCPRHLREAKENGMWKSLGGI